MTQYTADSVGLTGQELVEHVCQEALRTVRINHEHRTNYVNEALADLANVEADTMRKYHGRYIFELLQNANDAIIDEKNNLPLGQKKAYRVRIELTESALLVANDGSPFQEKDVQSIYRWGESSKDPNKSIGYKGIGFKSVLEITESPEIFSRVVQFHFDRELCYSTVREIVGSEEDLNLPFTRFVFPYSIAELPAPDKDIVDQLLNGAGFATVIRLPLIATVKPDEVLAQINEDVDPALLIFLNGLDEIDVWVGRKRIKQIYRESKVTAGVQGRELILFENEQIISRWLLFEAPKCAIEDRLLIDELKEKSWRRVSKVGFALAFPLDEKGRLLVEINEPTKLFVYFPTNERSGLRFRIHGDFYVDASRKSLEIRPYNLWLAHKISIYLSKIVVPELVLRYPKDERVVQVLVPLSIPQDFAKEVYQSVCHELSKCRFVPTFNGQITSPDKTLLAPRGVWVDLEGFQKYFPYSVFTKKQKLWQFPLENLYVYEWTIDFLIELGAKLLDYVDVFPTLDGRDPTGTDQDFSAFYSFIWKWRDRLAKQVKEDPSDLFDQFHRRDRLELLRHSFSSVLQKSYCIITSKGKWVKPHDQVYHAKFRQETPIMPDCLKADIVHPGAYNDGRSGAAYQLLSTFQNKVKDYDALDIIRTAIIPFFESGKFRQLSVVERVEIYKYLFDYWQSRRGGDPDIDQIVGSVEVYARLVSNRRQMEWRPIKEIYLSSLWTGKKLLERVYDGFENIAFLFEVRGLELTNEESAEWGRFWSWLGANRVPRLLIHEQRYLNWNSVNNSHPYRGTKLWGEYSAEIRDKYGTCPRHGRDKRVLQRTATLEGLAQLIQSQDVGRLEALFELLTENWPFLNETIQTKARLQCQGSGYCRVGEQTVSASSFVDYLLKRSNWVPARSPVNGQTSASLQPPMMCWFVSAGEDAIIRNMLPTPLIDVDTTNPTYRQFCRDIGMRFMEEAKLEDLVDILKNLPDQYPDPNINVYTGRRPVPKAVSTMTRWVIGRIYNLVTQSDYKILPIEDNIPLVASKGEELLYVRPPELVFFADDRYHSPRWREHLPFAPLDENWRDAAEYLRLKFLSRHVEEQVVPGNILVEETNRLMARYKQARPYMLALVNNQRTSSIEDVVRYLSNLEIQVVESLVVNRHLTIGNGKIIPDSDARIFLKERIQERVGSAGRAPRAGILYIRKGFENNCDLMGTPIADYVRIPGLSDAFVILLDRGGKDGRMKYLDTRSITEVDVEAMRTMLTHAGLIDEREEETTETIRDLDNHLMKRLERDSQDQKFGGEHGEPSTDNPVEKPSSEGDQESGLLDETKQREETSGRDELIEFPALVFTDINSIQVVAFEPAQPIGSGKGIDGHRRGGEIPNWERDHRLKEAYGERGEALVYELELRRLKKLGVERPEEIVCWLRKVGRSTANHDLESKDLIDAEWVDIIIEVKSSPGRDFRFEMSKEELHCAQENGTRYQLHRVINVSSATPVVYIYENPYHLWQRGLAVIEPRDTYVILPDPKHTNNNM